jgi:hypothetical protein
MAAHPKSAQAWLMAADAGLGPHSEYEALRHAYDLDPTLPLIHQRLAETAIRAGNPAAALANTRFAIRRSRPAAALLRAHVLALGANRRCREARDLAENRVPDFAEADLDLLRQSLLELKAQCQFALE